MTEAAGFFETLLPKNEIYGVVSQNRVGRTKNLNVNTTGYRVTLTNLNTNILWGLSL